MADDDRADERSEDDGPSEGAEAQEVTAPGEWERRPSDPEDRRHDDGSEPLAPPAGEDEDDDLAEQEAGDVRAGDDEDEEEGFDRPDPPEEAGLEDTGGALERHGEPLLEGSEVETPLGALPKRSLLAMAVFVLVFCAAFFGLWALFGNLGILLGLVAGTALGLGSMKLLADRAA
jgi:hypothetical protein